MAKGLKQIHTITTECIKNRGIQDVANQIETRLELYLLNELNNGKGGGLQMNNLPPNVKFQITFQRVN